MEPIETYGHFTPGFARSLTGKMGTRPMAEETDTMLQPITPPCRPRPAVGRGEAGGGAVRMAEETDTMLQPTQGGGREGGCNASYKRS
jgi:hypothetical protein